MDNNDTGGVMQAQTFSYRRPEQPEGSSKEIVLLCRNRRMRGAVHVVRPGGEEHLHSHNTIDGFWMILTGTARFYGEGDVLIGEFGPFEGVMTPRRTRYRFEPVGDEAVELLQVLAFDPDRRPDRQDHAAPLFDRARIKWFDARTGGKVSPNGREPRLRGLFGKAKRRLLRLVRGADG